LISSVLPGGDVGPYQVQAAIAAVHDEAKTMDATDWPQILALYDLLEQLAPSPMVSLNRAVAVAMVAGPGVGLGLLATLESDRRRAAPPRRHAARPPLLEMPSDPPGAAASSRKAARLTTSIPERRYLLPRAARLAGHSPPQVPEI